MPPESPVENGGNAEIIEFLPRTQHSSGIYDEVDEIAGPNTNGSYRKIPTSDISRNSYTPLSSSPVPSEDVYAVVNKTKQPPKEEVTGEPV